VIISDIDSLAPDTIRAIVSRSFEPGGAALSGQSVGILFEHPSLRTRSAITKAVFSLGGFPVTFVGDEIGIDKRETAEDVANLLAVHHVGVAARLVRQSTFDRMAKIFEGSGIWFVNLLTDWAHPTQALADVMTVYDVFGAKRVAEGEIEVAYLGDANNVARSLVKACIAIGIPIRVASPEGYAFSAEDKLGFERYSSELHSKNLVTFTSDSHQAATGASVLYTDVWVSMGEISDEEKKGKLKPYAITEELLALARKDAIVLHCLPAHRGQEIEASVIDGPRSQVWRQARNRFDSMASLLGVIANGG
jgi:ornithine carbamoyltransferase